MEITDDHLYLMNAFISSMVLDYSISNVRSSATFVRDFKKKSNNYCDFLNSEVYKQFQMTYDIDEENSEELFKELNNRIEKFTDDFINYMIKKD